MLRAGQRLGGSGIGVEAYKLAFDLVPLPLSLPQRLALVFELARARLLLLQALLQMHNHLLRAPRCVRAMRLRWMRQRR
eukprot:3085989-Rhodomonas_salina.5